MVGARKPPRLADALPITDPIPNYRLRQAGAGEKLYGTIEGGSYHVKIKTPGVSHNSFSDIRLLGRPDGAGINAWPADVRAVTPNGRVLKAICTWTRAFFDKTVRGIPGPLDELNAHPLKRGRGPFLCQAGEFH